MENSPKKQIVQKLKEAQNVLVTVSADPSVDQLAAAIGLTLFLNKLDKHATAVFSGQVPSTIEFLKPDETLEGTTDSLRDFIISLDKSKADKLRYKVEENVVKIFITPYRTHITQEDLNFEQGDFNVDVIVALGVSQREQLDQAITAHGRILHDASIVSICAGEQVSDLGSINWQNRQASSICEMVTSLTDEVKPKSLDEQIATALLTGIVAETDRFSNQRTTPQVMTASAQLMAAGANQQLVSSSLQAPEEPSSPIEEIQEGEQPAQEDDPSVLNVHHQEPEPAEEATLPPVFDGQTYDEPSDNIQIDDQGRFTPFLADEPDQLSQNEEDMPPNSRGRTIQPLRDPRDRVHPQAEAQQASSEQFSEYLDAPADAGRDVINATGLNDDLPLLDPLAPQPRPTVGTSTQSPLVSVQDDAESVEAKSIASTPHPQLPDDGETKSSTLGPQVAPSDTLDKIEEAVEDFKGEQPHETVSEPEPVFPGVELSEKPLEYESTPPPPYLPSVDTADTGLDPDTARKAVEQAMAASGGFDPNRPEPLQSVGSQPLELPDVPTDSEEPPQPPPPSVPPPLVPPFPTPGQ